MTVAFAQGLQGPDPKHWQAASLMKHFLANENEERARLILRRISMSGCFASITRFPFAWALSRAVRAR